MIRLERELEIGRGESGLAPESWQIDDATVSRRHAAIRQEADGSFLEDMGSRNGTWVSGALLRGQRIRPHNGALIMLGAAGGGVPAHDRGADGGDRAEQERPLGPVATASPGLALGLRRLRILAGTDRPVLLAGETGTGKEVYARAVHDLSGRHGPFMALNCASFNRDLFESHLFGYKRGSHSQASEDNPGVMASAEGGTVFLDEIGEMEAGLQTKLLRFLQDKTFLGLGFTRPRRADVRIVAATQSPHTTLREDILGRLGAEPVVLPALRRRREDLPGLCRHFLRRLPGQRGRVRPGTERLVRLLPVRLAPQHPGAGGHPDRGGALGGRAGRRPDRPRRPARRAPGPPAAESPTDDEPTPRIVTRARSSRPPPPRTPDPDRAGGAAAPAPRAGPGGRPTAGSPARAGLALVPPRRPGPQRLQGRHHPPRQEQQGRVSRRGRSLQGRTATCVCDALLCVCVCVFVCVCVWGQRLSASG